MVDRMEKTYRRNIWLTRLSAAFFTLSLILLVYSVLTTTVVFSKEDLFGLAEKLNIYYWMGLGLAVCAALMQVFSLPDWKSRKEKLFLLEACLLAVYLLAIPALTEESVFNYDTWQHASGSMSILSYRSYQQKFNVYTSEFPGVFMLGSIVYLVTGVEPTILMKFYPLFSSVMLALTAYVFLGRLDLDRRMVCLATLFLLSGIAFVFPRHFSPASIAVIWFLTIFYLAFSRPTRNTVALSLFLTFVMIMSHPTTLPFLILSALLIPAAVAVMRMLLNRANLTSQSVWSPWPFSKTFILLTVSAWLLWLMFNAPSQLTSLVNMVENFLSNLPRFLTPGRVLSRFEATPQHLVGQILKVAHAGLHFAIGGIGALVLIFGVLRRQKKDAFFFATLMGWMIACALLGLAAGFLRGGDLYERLILYGIAPLSVVAVYAFKSKYTKVVLLAAIVIGAPLSVLAAYSNEYFQYCPISDSYGSTFMLDHGVARLEDVEIAAPTARVYRFYLSYRIFQNRFSAEERAENPNPLFVWSQVSDNFYSFYLKGRVNETSELARIARYINMTRTTGFNIIYNNGDFQTGFFANTTGP